MNRFPRPAAVASAAAAAAAAGGGVNIRTGVLFLREQISCKLRRRVRSGTVGYNNTHTAEYSGSSGSSGTCTGQCSVLYLHYRCLCVNPVRAW